MRETEPEEDGGSLTVVWSASGRRSNLEEIVVCGDGYRFDAIVSTRHPLLEQLREGNRDTTA